MSISSKSKLYLAGCLAVAGLLMGCIPVVTLEPPQAVNPVGTSHTVVGTIVDGTDLPEICEILPEVCHTQASPSVLSDNVFFEIIAGPNAGKSSNGDCGPSGDDPCSIPGGGGSVSWTYVGNGGPGLDTIQFCPLLGTNIDESKALLAAAVTEFARATGVSEADLATAKRDDSDDEMAEVDPGCFGATKRWIAAEDRRPPNIGGGLSGLFAGQPTALPTAPAPAAVAPTSPTIRPPNTGDAGLR